MLVSMNTPADRILALLQKRGVPPRKIKLELADACKITYQSVQDWFTGETKEIKADNLQKIADKWNSSIEWLVSGRGSMDRTNEMKWSGGFDGWNSNTPIHEGDVELPLYKEVELSAGSGSQHIIEINGRRLRFSYSTLHAAGVQLENAACALVTGNSMEPRISDGATIGVDRARTQVKDGRIYAIDHDGMLRIKYLYKLPGGGLRLHSENYEEHPDESYSAKEVEERIKVLGWVFWVSQMNVW